MLFSNPMENGDDLNDELFNILTIEKCYHRQKIMCQQKNQSKSLRNVNNDDASTTSTTTITTKKCHPNRRRYEQTNRWQQSKPKTKSMPTTKRKQLQQQQIEMMTSVRRLRTLLPKQWNVISLLFIVLLSISVQSNYVYGARSRDNFNSIYLNNNHSVNNIIQNLTDSTDPIDASADAIQFMDNDLEIVDIDDLPLSLPTDQNFRYNVTVDGVAIDDFFDPYSSSNSSSGNRKLRRSPIYQNEFAVYVPSGSDEAHSIADKHGFVNMGQVSFTFHFFQFSFSACLQSLTPESYPLTMKRKIHQFAK